MKSYSVTHPNKGYTLVELLVVMAIIGTLASISIPLVGGFLKRGRASAAQTVISTIKTGFTDYYNDYSRYPGSSNPESRNGGAGLDEDGISFDSMEGNEITAIATGIDPIQNPKLKNYLTNVPATDTRSKPGIYFNNNEDAPEFTICSPWGKPYYIQFDQNYDGELIPTISRNHKALIDIPIVVWTHGPDGNLGTEDDVKSW